MPGTSVEPPSSLGIAVAGVWPAALSKAVPRAACAPSATGSATCEVPCKTISGGPPVRLEPGEIPMSPLIVVVPVLVIVPFVVLAGQTITNTGTTTINGDIGISPGSSLTGGPPLMVLHGTSHVADPVALGAQAALGTAFDNAAGQTPATAIPSELGGSTLVPGIYSSGVFTITNTLTLDAGNDPNAVFVFQSAATLNAAAGSRVNLINGASPCNVFWLVRSSATLETTANFSGNILALTDVHLRTGATVQGRALARNGEITLDANTITRPACGATPPVIAAPGAPTGVTVTPGNGQAVVSWTPSVSGGAACLLYTSDAA